MRAQQRQQRIFELSESKKQIANRRFLRKSRSFFTLVSSVGGVLRGARRGAVKMVLIVRDGTNAMLTRHNEKRLRGVRIMSARQAET
tara:strand:- start:23948 stop:24208 length:261 start_codon:yes stop_codon:yes gene_type:complete